jgi:hypothetical protein
MSLRTTHDHRKTRPSFRRGGRLFAAISLIVAAFVMATARPVYSAVVQQRAAHVPVYGCTVATEPSGDGAAHGNSGIPLGTALADFTGDHNPDVATLELQQLNASAAYYRLEIHLSEGGSQSLAVRGPSGRLLVTPMDVTGDGTLDLVIQAAETGVPVAVFLNDGCGHFAPNQPERFPRAFRPVSAGRRFANADVQFVARDVARGPNHADFEIGSGRVAEEHVDFASCRERNTAAFRRLQSVAGRAPPASA